ncbi:alpha/beta fold hydrolase [uncultured Methylovirgula sp.]|uniref:alpha/beta fold hydrolase n=1 Tax=uncultured Methylovirgula sp. TaxID=1285960 RepID=UPI002626425E|nr:alpha/beta fold hydrolase [uncultured Methylovirgula sp.]
MRRAWLLVALALLSAPAAAQSTFYDAPRVDAIGKPGTLVRAQAMAGAPLGAAAWRVLYRSTSFDGKPILVSGVVIVPQGAPPPGGRPIVAWAHPTTGIVPHCAPSLALFFFQQVQGLRTMVRDGYVVAATDYPGLGTPGPHPYLVGLSEARAVVDSVRVARTMPDAGGGNRYVVWGHSQGGHAALFTGLIAKSYAPELTLLGVAAAAPASELGALMDDDLDSPAGKNITAMTLWSWQRVYDAPMDKVVDPRARPAIDRLAQECVEGPWDLSARKRTEKPLEHDFLTVAHPDDVEPWRALLAKNTPGPVPADIPVFLAQGLDDEVIWPKVTQAYFDGLCKSGSKARLFLMPGVGHGAAAMKSALDAVAWMTARFAGETPPSDCGK